MGSSGDRLRDTRGRRDHVRLLSGSSAVAPGWSLLRSTGRSLVRWPFVGRASAAPASRPHPVARRRTIAHPRPAARAGPIAHPGPVAHPRPVARAGPVAGPALPPDAALPCHQAPIARARLVAPAGPIAHPGPVARARLVAHPRPAARARLVAHPGPIAPAGPIAHPGPVARARLVAHPGPIAAAGPIAHPRPVVSVEVLPGRLLCLPRAPGRHDHRPSPSRPRHSTWRHAAARTSGAPLLRRDDTPLTLALVGWGSWRCSRAKGRHATLLPIRCRDGLPHCYRRGLSCRSLATRARGARRWVAEKAP